MNDGYIGEIVLLQLKTVKLLFLGQFICPFIHSFIHSFYTHLLSTYLVPVSCLDIGVTTKKKTGLCPDGV